MPGKPRQPLPTDDGSIRERVLAVAADVAAPSESAEVNAALARGDPRYVAARREVETFLRTLSQITPMGGTRALAPVPPSVRERLLRRTRASGASGAYADKATTALRWSSPWFWASAASIGILVTAVAVLLVDRQRHVTRLADQATQLNAARQQIAEADTRLAHLESAVGSENLKLVSLAGDDNPKARGRVFWDLQANRWHFFAFDLAPPPPGRTYELWFITKDGTKTPAGTFDLDASGNGSVVAPVPPSSSPIALAAVTDEPIGGSAAPTGTIVLKGAVGE